MDSTGKQGIESGEWHNINGGWEVGIFAKRKIVQIHCMDSEDYDKMACAKANFYGVFASS